MIDVVGACVSVAGVGEVSFAVVGGAKVSFSVPGVGEAFVSIGREVIVASTLGCVDTFLTFCVVASVSVGASDLCFSVTPVVDDLLDEIT